MGDGGDDRRAQRSSDTRWRRGRSEWIGIVLTAAFAVIVIYAWIWAVLWIGSTVVNWIW
jgi:hypothetical protein